jgi:hypothetical protein
MIGSTELFVDGARESIPAAEAEFVRCQGHRTSFTVSTDAAPELTRAEF